ncbi:MAG: hypothetical protein N2116_05350 [Armatimonadetes bacterium]|nr:hypothetical protein [Armatimonadota bacterium]
MIGKLIFDLADLSAGSKSPLVALLWIALMEALFQLPSPLNFIPRCGEFFTRFVFAFGLVPIFRHTFFVLHKIGFRNRLFLATFILCPSHHSPLVVGNWDLVAGFANTTERVKGKCPRSHDGFSAAGSDYNRTACIAAQTFHCANHLVAIV